MCSREQRMQVVTVGVAKLASNVLCAVRGKFAPQTQSSLHLALCVLICW
jgi:hypothetical protein